MQSEYISLFSFSLFPSLEPEIKERVVCIGYQADKADNEKHRCDNKFNQIGTSAFYLLQPENRRGEYRHYYNHKEI